MFVRRRKQNVEKLARDVCAEKKAECGEINTRCMYEEEGRMWRN
jgi:hypothetical protein